MQTHIRHRWAKYAALLFMVAVIWACNGCSLSKTNIEYQCFTKAACDNENT
jgi:hypothetical protein